MKKLSGHTAVARTNDCLEYNDLVEATVASPDYSVIECRVNCDASEDACAGANHDCSVSKQNLSVLIDDQDQCFGKRHLMMCKRLIRATV